VITLRRKEGIVLTPSSKEHQQKENTDHSKSPVRRITLLADYSNGEGSYFLREGGGRGDANG